MKTIDKALPTMKLEDFADKHGLSLEICERNPRIVSDPNARFFAHLIQSNGCGIDIHDGHMLRGSFCDGGTKEEAVEDMKRVYSNTNITLDNGKTDIAVPILK